MADISKITTPDGKQYDLKDSIARQSVLHVVKGTQSSSTGTWLGSIPVSALSDGLTIAYYLPRSGNGNATLTLTLSDNSTTAAVPVYYNGNTRMTTQYPAGSMIFLTYWGSGSISIDGTSTNAARWVGNGPDIALEWEELDT